MRLSPRGSPEGACPECGKPVRESLMTTRPGTAWQRRRGLAGWISTTFGVLLGDPAVWRKAQTSGAPGLRLAILNSILAPVVGSVGPVVMFLLTSEFRLAWGAFAWSLALAALLVVVSVASCWALMLYADLRRRDLTPERARIIVGHATSIWWFPALGVALGAAGLTAMSLHEDMWVAFVWLTGMATAVVSLAVTPFGYAMLLSRGLRLTGASVAIAPAPEN